MALLRNGPGDREKPIGEQEQRPPPARHPELGQREEAVQSHPVDVLIRALVAGVLVLQGRQCLWLRRRRRENALAPPFLLPPLVPRVPRWLNQVEASRHGGDWSAALSHPATHSRVGGGRVHLPVDQWMDTQLHASPGIRLPTQMGIHRSAYLPFSSSFACISQTLLIGSDRNIPKQEKE